ncbi:MULTISPECIES: hydantoinase B/oxoprolinase family protein [unclassified Bradyrhizobium]|uniref:hydantoinase B/oxoprolinase family protein n=1 Tax=unclassified Bradyrhizobium TaxID=2631580 RepID=UPI0020B24E4B|nr:MULTISPECIES: hydantoinase B/oxoprolinase family protein [unclassified Bradyrhizobium]MCP3384920.1 hydantoinase B/oxoprolinase family protein [Bradyrhizobium sp. CCGUVB4N]MCP3446029.1 hydantoinase B/oxoprolinase family protein [Bradyrhizobium sp. CCGUVB14]
MSVNAADFNDPINLQVMWNRLIFIADQADIVLGRTAFSPIVRENHDYVTVLLDSRGRALAQCTWSIPVFITSLPVAAQKYFLPKFPAETLQEGDVLATNDPEIGTGHLPDVTMITPIFKNGKVVAYAGSIAHLPDIGGAPLHSEASDIFEEGIRFPIVKLHKAGVPNQDVLDIIAASVRLPTEVMGDLESMVAANNVMGRELVKFLDEYGLDGIDELADAIHTRSEAQTRRAIRQWPNGTYSAEVLLDGYDTDVTLKAAVIVRDDSIHVDYTGTSEQILHSINCRTNYRYAHSVYALKCLLDPDTPNNEGCITPITDEAPLGSILNPEEWTAGNSRNLIGHVIPSLIFKALEGVVPDKVMGDSGGAPIWAANCVGRRDDGSQYGSVQNFHGGQGARAEFDGLDTLSFPSNCRVTAIEMFEIAVPALTECKELIADSGGAGRSRGGLGQRVVLRNLGRNPMNIYLASERVRHPCFGVVGGKSGSAGKVYRNGEPQFPKGKVVLKTGDRLEVETPGGGGWGRTADRTAAAIELDLAEGLITPEAARQIYGYQSSSVAATAAE